ncbi:MAG: NAD(P)H-hydrate dehydratase [Acidobacteria bacterium]|nr:NAD(P)H-hydrate dehydratase [Acidobacteriota bacterium]
MRVLTADQMREADRVAIEELGVPGLVLMENAALGVVQALAERFPETRSVAIFCGPGNNGGDGLAVARHLEVRGYHLEVFGVAPRESYSPSGDAGVQAEICQRMGIDVRPVNDEPSLARALAAAAGCDLVVDAVFGTGLHRPLEGRLAAWAEGLNRLAVPVLAVDLPSGLDADRSEPPGPHVRARCTVTFAAPKVAQVLDPAAEAVGELVVTDLGVPLCAEEPAEGGGLHLLLEDELAGFLGDRRAASHKGDYGHLLVVAGSPGKSGAAVLAARAAVRGGAGLVTAAVPEPLLATVDAGSVESMTLACPATSEGLLARGAVDTVLGALESKDAVALGPGLGQGSETRSVIREIVLGAAVPLILDADGLNAFTGDAGALSARPAATVLTPHPGELARLLGVSTAEIQADRWGAARRAAAETGAVVVLKGHRTLIATPAGEAWINTTGNPGMATGGTGDVLTGLVGSFLAQSFDPLAAAQLAVFAHGAAGDLAAAETGLAGLAAGDLLGRLPAVLRRLETL